MTNTTKKNITEKNYPELAEELQKIKRMGVLLSGGCDSEVLQRAAVDVLGPKNTIAFHASTPFITDYYKNIVKNTASKLKTKLVYVKLNPLQIKDITTNTEKRCYYCKKAIYSSVIETALTHNITKLADGTNLDDTKEHRPGRKAAAELKILQPFLKTKMTKAKIRHLGKLLNMEDSNRPSDSCLATRVNTNTPITEDIITIISKIEEPLRPHVKGRLRAKASKKQINLHYQKIDSDLINTHKNTLKAIADYYKKKIIFTEIADS